MKFWQKMLWHAREIWYRRARVWLPFNPRIGVCEVCGRMGRTNRHHWKYGFPTSEVKQHPLLGLLYTNELCGHHKNPKSCHRLADAIRNIYEVMEKEPEKIKKLFKLREEALQDQDIIDSLNRFCRRKNIHFCCLICKKNCKQKETYWSGCMPCSEYCENFKEDRAWKKALEETP